MRQRKIVLNVLLSLFLFAALPANAIPGLQGGTMHISDLQEMDFVPGEILIGYSTAVSQQQYPLQAFALAEKVNATVVEQSGDMVLLQTNPADDLAQLVALLSAEPGVKYAQPNYIARVPEKNPLGPAVEIREFTRVNPDGDTQVFYANPAPKGGRTTASQTYPDDEWANWGNEWVGHDLIWPEKKVSPVVCVVDTGVDQRHPDLSQKVLSGYDFVNNDRFPQDDHGHGTHVTGVIAAKFDNNQGVAGISNGKVLAVKSLNAQGWGTSFDIASGIRYCADNKSVKVINLSLSLDDNSGEDTAIYEALEYAIHQEDKYGNPIGKLIVAAAGNTSSSEKTFPAAWASADTPAPGSQPNTISSGILSVGAVRRNYFDQDPDLWVDHNENSLKDPGESYKASHCATDSTGFGSWVEILAPGESIYSTTPVSYPFTLNFFDDVSSGYDWLSGTSFAAPHVAAAAARTWSVFSGESNQQIHDRLIAGGDSLAAAGALAVDQSASNPSLGYQNPGYRLIDYDHDAEGTLETIKAPFCWPDGSTPFGAAQDMSAAVFLNIPGAMERGAVILEATDATTGLPLTGAAAKAVNSANSRISVTSKMTWTDSNEIHLLNIPAGEACQIMLSKRGYTSGYQWIGEVFVSSGKWNWGKGSVVGVPPNKAFTAVINWDIDNETIHNLDLFTFLPATANGVVGAGYSGHGRDYGPGTLQDFPFAIYHRDGGQNGAGSDLLPVESISISRFPRQGFPYYIYLYPNEVYDFLVRGAPEEINASQPVLRVWYGGKIMLTSVQQDLCQPEEYWWLGGSISRIGPTAVGTSLDKCGTDAVGEEEGVWPYAGDMAILTIFGN